MASRAEKVPTSGPVSIAETEMSETTALLPVVASGSSEQTKFTAEDEEVAHLVHSLFIYHTPDHHHPKTVPALCPEKRGKRHRHPTVYQLNEFRHWWKTSRLLVRLTGSYAWCNDSVNWAFMAALNVTKNKQARKALKQVKHIARGGPNRDFLKDVHPLTRTLRLVIAILRGLEARVDNRLIEVGLAELMAFMGNRCFRYWARHLTDEVTMHVMFPISAKVIAPYLEQQSRPVVVLMGLVRAILPFCSSFFGSAFGRKLTFHTFRAHYYRWKPMQSIFHFHEKSGVYKDIDPDEQLAALAQQVAVAIGHGKDPVLVRNQIAADVGFAYMFGAGSGGYSVYRMQDATTGSSILLHVTPYGPSVVDIMPRYIILERRSSSTSRNVLLNAAVPMEATVVGYTYSGAFFTSQEWAALQNRFEEELACYRNACKIMGTDRSHINSTSVERNELAFPPTDLPSLKAFIRTGQSRKKQRKADKKWNQIQREVQKMAKTVQQHQNNGTAPKGVILYMEGLDCSGKSSTGGLVQQALEDSGFQVEMRQHNRPPTDEQKQMAWMARFERPAVVDTDEYKAMVWDRGPAGDFVYGNLASVPEVDKIERYAEFRAFDRHCQADGILFCKLLFVTDKDTIAATLGKRLAQKKIAQELRTWLDANSDGNPQSLHEGLAAIEAHIDPTDFIAFNKFSENLGNFCDFARNTDHNGYDNPWFVVCTSNRHAARLALIKAFQNQIAQFSEQLIDTTDQKDAEAPPIPVGIVEAREHGVSYRAVFQTFLLLCLTYAYIHQTWTIDLIDRT